ncbi:MAG: hypothetical protein E3J72_16475 [Planctomycetota bacterium]|nr:MAG: hypothetical protein E3J72_16475 [Planctomycetota bacterium]
MAGRLTVLFLAAVMLFAPGCAFLRQRGADAADIFSADVGLGYGLGASVSVTEYVGFNIGMAHAEKYGIIGRKAGTWHEMIIGFPASWFYLYRDADINLCLGCAVSAFVNVYGRDRSIKKTKDIYELRYALIVLAEDEGSDSPFKMTPGTIALGVHPLFFGIRVGIDPVEFADFLAGWLTIDFMDDDEVIEEDEEEGDYTPDVKPPTVPGEDPKDEFGE